MSNRNHNNNNLWSPDPENIHVIERKTPIVRYNNETGQLKNYTWDPSGVPIRNIDPGYTMLPTPFGSPNRAIRPTAKRLRNSSVSSSNTNRSVPKPPTLRRRMNAPRMESSPKPGIENLLNAAANMNNSSEDETFNPNLLKNLPNTLVNLANNVPMNENSEEEFNPNLLKNLPNSAMNSRRGRKSRKARKSRRNRRSRRSRRT